MQGFAREALPQRPARGITQHEIRVIQVFLVCKIEVLSSVNDIVFAHLPRRCSNIAEIYLGNYLVFHQYGGDGGVAPTTAWHHVVSCQSSVREH